MKIRIWLLSFFILLFCGCSSKAPPVPVTEFTASAVVSISDSLESRQEFSAKIVSAARGVVSITLTGPPQVSGLCCKWGKEFEMSYKELLVKGDTYYLPDFAFARVVYEVLWNLRENPLCKSYEGEVAIFEGEVTAGRYTVQTDPKGNILQISVKEINLTIEFSYKE